MLDTPLFKRYLRSGLRKMWLSHPARRQALKEARQLQYVINKGKHLYRTQCAVCEYWFKCTDIQVDHIVPAGSLTPTENLGEWVEKLLLITKDDLRCLCKDCHAVVSYAEKHDLSVKEAKRHKTAIAYMKLNGAEKQKDVIKRAGYKPAKTVRERREQIIKIIKEIEDEK